MCCRGNRDLITAAIRGLFWWSSVWPRLQRSELRGARLQARVLAACAIHCNYRTLLPFMQITVIILRLDVLISNRCYLNTKLLVTRRIQNIQVIGQSCWFFFALRLVLKLQESSQTAFKWNMCGWGKLSHFLLECNIESGLVYFWKSVLV